MVAGVCPRGGSELKPAGRGLRVSSSRPARVLTAALQLIERLWRYDLLYDFLNLPLIKRCLEESHRLHDLFDYRPRARRPLDHRVWEQAWHHHLQRLRDRIERWNSGDLDLPEHTLLTRQEFVARQREVAASLERLIESIKGILKPGAVIASLVGGATPLEELVGPCVQFLRALKIDQWLTPHRQQPEQAERQYGVAVPWVEYEKDQQAYYKLLEILKTLPAIARNRLPLTQQGRLDAIGALQLVLDSETYQIKTEDDVGVQLFVLREIRGLRFLQVYALGLFEGQRPQFPEEEAFCITRRPLLRTRAS